jgi:hypothetical protein
MRLRWDPSVRTRHLAVILALALTAVGALTSFNLTRMLGVRLAARHRAQEALADALYQITQQVILDNPGKDARLLLGTTLLSTLFSTPARDLTRSSRTRSWSQRMDRRSPKPRQRHARPRQRHWKDSSALRGRSSFIYLRSRAGNMKFDLL